MDFRGKNIDLVGKQNLWFGISLAIIVVGLLSWFIFGPNLGIDFKGGGQLQYLIPYSKRPSLGQETKMVKDANQLLEKQGLRQVRTQIAGGDTLIISTAASFQAQLSGQERMVGEALNGYFAGTSTSGQPQQLQLIASQLVGPVIGQELRDAAIKGVLIGVFLIALWIYVRYNFAGDGLRYAVAGIVALIHDVLVLGGLYALIGHIWPKVEMDSTFIAALLTVVGYSINDSVVIFDRIRENLRLRRKEPFNTVVNESLLETMSRSINTGATVLIMLLFLLLFGGESIFNFILAMLIGITSGLYSSIFNASMVLTAWHSFDEKKAEAQRLARGDRNTGRTVTVRDTTTRPVLAGGSSATLASANRPATRPAVPSQPAAPSQLAAASAEPMMPAPAETSIDDADGSSDESAGPVGAARPPRKARAKRRF